VEAAFVEIRKQVTAEVLCSVSGAPSSDSVYRLMDNSREYLKIVALATAFLVPIDHHPTASTVAT
jgi:hypothetical protein